MDSTAERLDTALRAAGIVVVSVSIGDPANKATWTVQPSSQQAAAQPVIEALPMVPPPPLPAPVPGRYLGVVEADPASPHEGDLWIVREAFPTQRRIMKCRDGAVTRTFHTLVL